MGRMEPPAEGASLATQWAALRLWGPGSGMRTGEEGRSWWKRAIPLGGRASLEGQEGEF